MKLTKLATCAIAVATVVLSAGVASAQTSTTTTKSITTDNNGNYTSQTSTTTDSNGNYNSQTSTTSNTTTASRGMNRSYIGAGISAGVTNGGRQNDAALLGGNVQGRYALKNAPVSVRGAVLFGGDSVAIVPTLTYDAAIAKNTNLYLGGGYSFVTDDGQASQLGNKNAPVLTLGAESQVAKNTVIYSDAKFGIDAYKGSDSDALSLQAGVGYSF
ncbi:hypothetical protein G7B40_022015 [Aetokthonos hydrillicola Thurmond2011]|jgi:hypothetical protein|uniref:Outer membrane protein beta-barrel domain-containing protein n=1 Tax=Aetokthonos hydrillicola Thurmond2011 TaxID=2712845 RepID=A0AAP5IBH9_9CYAN|nr:hypothetical protein [Aetokthonos hydrillicola]MDR9897219.1 hypothetical protein [Aetokthonos hydrillicola Thurmond2011]